MKRFLALFATMAIIVSMFSGVVLAQPPEHLYNIELDNDTVTYMEGFNYTTLTGRIVDSETGAVRDVSPTLDVFRDDGDGVFEPEDDDVDVSSEVLGRDVDGGFFSLTFLTDLGIGTYFVATNNQGYVYPGSEASFTIMYAVELVEPTTLEWVWGDIPDTVIVQGMFTNEDNVYDAEDILLFYQDENGAAVEFIAEADFANDSVFGFLFSGDDFYRTGELGLYINVTEPDEEVVPEGEGPANFVLALEGEVVPAEMDVTVDPMEAMVDLGDVEFTATFDFDSEYIFDDQGTDRIRYYDGYQLWLSIDGPDEDAPWEFNLTYLFADPKVTGMLPLNGIDPGTYEFTFTLEREMYLQEAGLNPENGRATFILEEATVEVEALEPEDYNLVGWNDDPLKVGDNEFGFCLDADRPIVVKNEDGEGCAFYYEVIFNGAGLDDKTVEGNRFDEPFTISPMETGVVEVTINVYEDDMILQNSLVANPYQGPYVDIDAEDPVATFTRELAVEGWNITITPDVVEVDSETDITITITDEEGNPVNNAIITSDLNDMGFITIPGEVLFDAGTTNVVGGVYVIEYDDDKMAFDRVGFEDLQFWTEEQFENTWRVFEWTPDCDWTDFPSEINMREAIEVVGHDVYNVTCDTPVLLEGFWEEVTVTPLDAEGDVIYPNITITFYDDEDNELDTFSFTGTRVDLNDDGIKESIESDVLASPDAVRGVIRAESSDAKEFGEVELEVVKPQVVMSKASVLTTTIETEIEFTVIDPRDGSLLEDNDVYFSWHRDDDEDYVCDLMDADGDSIMNVPLPEDDGVFAETVISSWVDYYEAEEDEFDVVVVLLMQGDEYEFYLTDVPVVLAQLTPDPEVMVIGTAGNIVLTYTDAEGNPLVGYDVYLGNIYYGDTYDEYDTEEEIGTTDENGQVAYATIATNTGDLTFIAETDRCIQYNGVPAVVDITVDLEPPTATLMEANGMATITIKDNVRVTKAMVNGVLVDMFYAAPTVVHMMPQTDLYHVQAIDQNFNYLMVTLEGARAHRLTVVIGQDCAGFGPAELLGDTTMVPVRYAEELGAVVTWNEVDGTVTYSINGGEVVITVQVGNMTAMVNGVPMMMEEAPYISSFNRVMVPIRMIAEELGFTVDWVGNGTTYIY